VTEKRHLIETVRFIAKLTPDKPYSCKMKLYMVVKQLPYNHIETDVNSLCKLRFFSFTAFRKVDRPPADGHCPESWWGRLTCSLQLRSAYRLSGLGDCVTTRQHWVDEISSVRCLKQDSELLCRR
jgi:hypothetical protein